MRRTVFVRSGMLGTPTTPTTMGGRGRGRWGEQQEKRQDEILVEQAKACHVPRVHSDSAAKTGRIWALRVCEYWQRFGGTYRQRRRRQARMPEKITNTPYPLIDADPYAGRVIRYLRPSDYAVWAGATGAFPAALYLWGECPICGGCGSVVR